MSDYTKVTNFTAKDAANSTILGSDFETEFGAVQTMSTTKANKATSPTANNLAKVSGTGDLEDSGLQVSNTPQTDEAETWAESQTFAKSAVFDAVVDNGTGSTKTFTWANGNKQKLSMNANGTFTFTAPAGAANLLLKVYNSGGSRTITWPGTVVWPGGVIPTPSASSKIDLYMFFYDGASYYGSMVGNY